MGCELCHSKDDHEFGCPDQDTPIAPEKPKGWDPGGNCRCQVTKIKPGGRDTRLQELRDCVDDEERIRKVLIIEEKLKPLPNWQLRSTACDMAEKLTEASANMDLGDSQRAKIQAETLTKLEEIRQLQNEAVAVTRSIMGYR